MTQSDTFQFFPTPRALAERAFAKFRHPVERLLEPSAGNGDLLVATEALDEDGHPRWGQRRVPASAIDVLEIDLTKHPLLRSKGYRVVGHDFLKYSGATIYSHILMNPPFAQGAEHVIHAWDALWSGEIVALLNAETVRSICTKKRELLTRLIEQHSASEPEFVQAAFLTSETERQTEVEVVIIHLEKVVNFRTDFLDGLEQDAREETTAADFGDHRELVIPANWIANQVTAFNLATRALREAAFADVRASYYAGMLGKSLAECHAEESEPVTPIRGRLGKIAAPPLRGRDAAAKTAQTKAAERINEGYLGLKESAWTSVLRSTEVTSRLSSAAQQRLAADFKSICMLEFSVENVYGFLGALIAKQGEIQLSMVCDVFDLFSTFRADNTCYFQGWKSNSKHRTCGLAVKASRIVLPAHRRDWYSNGDGFGATSLDWKDQERFADMDRCFEMLDDNKSHGLIVGLNDLFHREWGALCSGKRVAGTYFDVRFYPSAGTFHLFPKNKALIDRLNRLVGKHRQWLPPVDEDAPAAFWEQFSKAEQINKAADLSNISRWDLENEGYELRQRKAMETLTLALQAATAKLGIDYDQDALLTGHGEALQLPLLDAA